MLCQQAGPLVKDMMLKCLDTCPPACQEVEATDCPGKGEGPPQVWDFEDHAGTKVDVHRPTDQVHGLGDHDGHVSLGVQGSQIRGCHSGPALH